MHILEIHTPGTELKITNFSSQRAKWTMEDMLSSLKQCFFDATLALNLFEQSRLVSDPDPTLEQFQKKLDRLSELEKNLEVEHDRLSTSPFRAKAESMLKREQWNMGHLPEELERRIPFLHAKSFISAIDGFDRLLSVITESEGAPPLTEIYLKLQHALPQLRKIRNSVQHSEDTIRELHGQGKNKKRIILQPISADIAPPELPVLITERINSSSFGTTVCDGKYVEIEITPSTLKILQNILQEVLDSFSWSGPADHSPGYAKLSRLYK